MVSETPHFVPDSSGIVDSPPTAAVTAGARGLGQKIKDWTTAKIKEALDARGGRTSLKVNGAQIAVRQHLDVQMSGATGEDHPELDLTRVILTGGGLGRCSAFLKSATLDISASTVTNVPLDKDEVDPDGWHNEGTASPYIIVPTAGDYLISARFGWVTEGPTDPASGTYRRLKVEIVGATGGLSGEGGYGTDDYQAPTALGSWVQEIAAHIVQLNAGATIKLQVEHDGDGLMGYNSTGGSRPSLTVVRLG